MTEIMLWGSLDLPGHEVARLEALCPKNLCHLRGSPQEFRSNFGPIQEGDWATFSAVSDTRCSTYLIFTTFLTAECSTVELPGNRATHLFSF